MRTARISELKAKLSAHIQFVKNGEEVLILDRNTPVARLVPAGVIDDYSERERRLIAAGILTPPKRKRILGERWPVPAGPNIISDETMDRIWREERGE